VVQILKCPKEFIFSFSFLPHLFFFNFFSLPYSIGWAARVTRPRLPPDVPCVVGHETSSTALPLPAMVVDTDGYERLTSHR